MLYIVKAKKTFLRIALTSTDSVVKVHELSDIDGNPLSMSDFGDWFVVVVKQGNLVEMIKCDGITQNIDGTADLDIATNGRSLLPVSPYTGAATGDDFQTGDVIVTNDPYTMSIFASLINDQTFNGLNTFTQSPIVPTPVLPTDAVNKAYADALTYAGAPDASTDTKGIVERATQAEVNAGTDAGGTTAPLFPVPSNIANAVQTGTWLKFTETASGDDSYTATTTPVVVEAEGVMVNGVFATANTGACTFALNAGSALAIKRYVAGAIAELETGDIIADMPVLLRKTGAVWLLMNPIGSMPTTALLSEMAAFFGATDITGAEAETLTAGITAPIVTLHAHGRSTVNTSYDLTTASSSINYAHGLGAIPNWVRVTALTVTPVISVGEYLRVPNTNKYIRASNTGAGNNTSDGSLAGSINIEPSAGARATGVISVDATNITVAWTKTGSPPGTAYLLFECGV